jgi:4-hydroxy-tetrahydrodipicolinate synthase
MKKILFKGAATALITPFKDGEVDIEVLKKLTEFQIEQGISALVVCGTTGEAPTLSSKEKIKCVSTVCEACRGRVPVIAGTTTNDTASSVNLSKEAVREGADGILAVTPYYNRPSASGLLRHFLSVAEGVGKPTILYNIPSRTGSDISESVYEGFSTHPMAAGVKEASGSISKCAYITSSFGDSLPLYSGNDDMTLPVLAVGGVGVISVVSNMFPRQMSELCRLYETNAEECLSLYKAFVPLMRSLFTETNPMPIKSAMAYLKLCSGELRLPLTRASGECERVLFTQMEKFKAAVADKNLI